MLDLALEERAKQCALHIALGKLDFGPPLLHDQTVETLRALPALFNAIHFLPDPQVIDALLKNCGANFHVNQDIDGLLPLHFLLGDLVKVPRLSNWSPEQPLLELILLLFLLPEAKPKLDCAELVAKYTDSVNEVALGFIEHGELIQLAALLLVAHERVLSPFGSGQRETNELSTSMERINSADFNGCSITSIAAALLLEIFETAGDELTMYYKSMPTTGFSA